MRGQAGFWDIDERYARLSEAGDPLEKLNSAVPWEVFRKPLAKALKRSVIRKFSDRLGSRNLGFPDRKGRSGMLAGGIGLSVSKDRPTGENATMATPSSAHA